MNADRRNRILLRVKYHVINAETKNLRFDHIDIEETDDASKYRTPVIVDSSPGVVKVQLFGGDLVKMSSNGEWDADDIRIREACQEALKGYGYTVAIGAV
jgi:hypothetical protein